MTPDFTLLASGTVREYTPVSLNHRVLVMYYSCHGKRIHRRNSYMCKSQAHGTMNRYMRTHHVSPWRSRKNIPSVPGFRSLPSPEISTLPTSITIDCFCLFLNPIYEGSYDRFSCVRLPLLNLIAVQFMSVAGFFWSFLVSIIPPYEYI